MDDGRFRFIVSSVCRIGWLTVSKSFRNAVKLTARRRNSTAAGWGDCQIQHLFSNPAEPVRSGKIFNHQILVRILALIDNSLMLTQQDFLENGSFNMTNWPIARGRLSFDATRGRLSTVLYAIGKQSYHHHPHHDHMRITSVTINITHIHLKVEFWKIICFYLLHSCHGQYLLLPPMLKTSVFWLFVYFHLLRQWLHLSILCISG